MLLHTPTRTAPYILLWTRTIVQTSQEGTRKTKKRPRRPSFLCSHARPRWTVPLDIPTFRFRGFRWLLVAATQDSSLLGRHPPLLSLSEKLVSICSQPACAIARFCRGSNFEPPRAPPSIPRRVDPRVDRSPTSCIVVNLHRTSAGATRAFDYCSPSRARPSLERRATPLRGDGSKPLLRERREQQTQAREPCRDSTLGIPVSRRGIRSFHCDQVPDSLDAGRVDYRSQTNLRYLERSDGLQMGPIPGPTPPQCPPPVKDIAAQSQARGAGLDKVFRDPGFHWDLATPSTASHQGSPPLAGSGLLEKLAPGLA